MPATLATCEVYGTIHDVFAQPVQGAVVGVMAVYKQGALVLSRTREVETDVDGYFTLELPRGPECVAILYANTPGLNISALGTPTAIPDADSAELTSIIGDYNLWEQVPVAIPIGAGVSSFNGRTGAVVLTDMDVTGALGYTPADAAALAGYLLLAGGTMTGPLALSADPVAAAQAANKHYVDTAIGSAIGALPAGVLSFNGRTGAVTLTSADVTAALGYTPANAAALAGYVPLAGAAMTGFLTLSADPTAALHAATRQWVLAQIGAIPAGGVTSFNSRTGAVVPAGGDYAAFYAALTHTHTRAQITDLGVFSTSQPGLVPQPTAGDAAKVLTGAGTWVAQTAAAPVTSVFTRTGAVTALVGDYSAFYLGLGGGTLTGFLTLNADPSNALHAATRQWVLAQITATAPVTSVFTRTGAVVAQSADYSAFYAALNHTHTRAQITDLGIFSTSQPGLVPQPTAGDAAKFLTGAGTWAAASGGGSVDTAADYIWTGSNSFVGVPLKVQYLSNWMPGVDMNCSVSGASQTFNVLGGTIAFNGDAPNYPSFTLFGDRLEFNTYGGTYNFIQQSVVRFQMKPSGRLFVNAPSAITDVGAAALQIWNSNLAGANYTYGFICNGPAQFTGAVVLPADPVNALEAATKQYVDAHGGPAYTAVNKAGDTMLGILTLSGNPSGALDAVPKQYSDLNVPKAGGTMTGLLTLSADATSALHAVTKQQLDARHGAGANGSNATVQMQSELLTLSTAGLTTDTVGNLLPAGAIILAVTARVTTTITTTTDWKLGDATVADRFSAANATKTSGTTTIGLNQWNATRVTAGMGPDQAAAAKVRVTCTGSNPGAGAIRISVWYVQLTAPTS